VLIAKVSIRVAVTAMTKLMHRSRSLDNLPRIDENDGDCCSVDETVSTTDDDSLHNSPSFELKEKQYRETIQKMQRHNQKLSEKCQELEEMITDTRIETKWRTITTATAIGTSQRRIERAEQDNETLLEQCEVLAKNLGELRKENSARQKQIYELDTTDRM
jgi:chromosome segregation ATPase